MKVVRHRRIEGTMKNCTVTKTKSGKYFVSIQCEYETPDPIPVNDESVGIDLGIKTFAVLSDDSPPIESPTHLRKAERLLQIRQRRVSRKQKGSRSRDKARHNVAVLHEKIANQRKDFHHKVSREIVNCYGCIGLEDLNIRGMVKNHHLAKSIVDAGWGQFVQFLTYKAAWASGEIFTHDRWFASSKTCHVCGEKNKSLKLSDRIWVCLRCNVVHDRDYNAAMNLKPVKQHTHASIAPRTAGAAGIDAVGDTSSAVTRSAPEKFIQGSLILDTDEAQRL